MPNRSQRHDALPLEVGYERRDLIDPGDGGVVGHGGCRVGAAEGDAGLLGCSPDSAGSALRCRAKGLEAATIRDLSRHRSPPTDTCMDPHGRGQKASMSAAVPPRFEGWATIKPRSSTAWLSSSSSGSQSVMGDVTRPRL